MKHELTPEVVKQIVNFAKKYEPKGDLVGIPREVISVMLQNQYEQTGKWDVDMFKRTRWDGFSWNESNEGQVFWGEVLADKNFTPFFTRYPERFENKPQYRDSLGYPLELWDDIYCDDDSLSIAIGENIVRRFNGMGRGTYYTYSKMYFWKYAISVKAYKNNPTEVMERIKQLEQKNQSEPVKEEEKPTKPVYVTPCGTFTEGEEVIVEGEAIVDGSKRRIFYRYDERLECPYHCVFNSDRKQYLNGNKFEISLLKSISKIHLPSIEEVASKAGISVEQLKEIIKEWK